MNMTACYKIFKCNARFRRFWNSCWRSSGRLLIAAFSVMFVCGQRFSWMTGLTNLFEECLRHCNSALMYADVM